MTRGESPQAVADAFLAHSPRPKSRKHREPKPGDPATVLHITEDTSRHLALVRGLNVRHVLELANVLERARWSVSAGGYVVSSADLADVCAMAGYSNVPYRVKRVGDG